MPKTSHVRWIAVVFGIALTWPGDRAWAQTPAQPLGTAAARIAATAPEDPTESVTAADLAVNAGFGALYGAPIVRTEVVVVGGLWATKEEIRSVRIGAPASAEAARTAARELLGGGESKEGGRFAHAAADYYAEGNGAVLRVAVLPRRLIARLQVTGAVLDRSETLEAASLSDGGEITAPAMERARRVVLEHYAKHGFPDARARLEATDTDDPMRVVLSMDIEAGEPLVIAQRVFVIEPRFDAQVGAMKQKYKVAAGARADESTLGEADRELADLLRQQGFLRADVGHEVARKGSTAELLVNLRPGPRTVPIFEGQRAVDATSLLGAIDLAKGDAARPQDLVDRVKAYYVARGFLDVDVEVTEQESRDGALLYLRFEIHENARVRVAGHRFPCLPKDSKEEDIKDEIQSFLDEDLPSNMFLSTGDGQMMLEPLSAPSAVKRPTPITLDPSKTYAAEPYERAVRHLRDLFYSRGYLNAIVGPLELERATCASRSPTGACEPVKLARVAAKCAKDELQLPIADPPLPASHTCKPDPARHITCAPEVTVVIPIHPGPRSDLYDLAFEGNRAFVSKRLAKIAALTIGGPLSTVDLEAARLRILESYKNSGYAYTDVRVSVETSPDRTRGRAKFSIVEHEPVMVTGIVIRGNRRTEESLIRGRIALKEGQLYKQDLVRISEERIAALGTFSSVSIGLEDPEVPQRGKRVVITVVEQLPQYLDPKIGFSTGEGVRFSFEYGHKNIAGEAISLTLRVQLSYLPDVLILDPAVRERYTTPPSQLPGANPRADLTNIGYRLERRNALSIAFPDVRLGPLFSMSIDGIDVHDLQRDYGITKDALIATLTFRPTRSTVPKLDFSKPPTLGQFSLSAELNDVQVFNEKAKNSAIGFLRVPDGQTLAFGQRLAVTYDARNNPVAATSGALLSVAVEHVTALPTDTPDNPATETSDFLKWSGRVAAYIPLRVAGASVAMSLAGGVTAQFLGSTYPDRLLFLGGVDSIRSFLADAVVPQDVAEQITSLPDCLARKEVNPDLLCIEDVAIRGGNLSLNPRVELRVPIPISTLQLGAFVDMGNVWRDPLEVDLLKFRLGIGGGLRIGTPIGPIALDLGFNPKRYTWEDVAAFHFSIGLF